MLAVAALVWTPFVLAAPLQSHDVYQYVAYARIELVFHANPYVVAPSAFPSFCASARHSRST